MIPGLLLLAACHKDNNAPAPTGDGYWKLYVHRPAPAFYVDTTYSIRYAARSTKNGYAVLSGMDLPPGRQADSLQLWFKTLPATSGQYKVVLFPGASGLGDNEMAVSMTMPGGDLYTSTGIGSNETWLPPANAVVSVTGGKIKVDVPSMTFIWTNSVTMGWDSTLFIGGSLIEK